MKDSLGNRIVDQVAHGIANMFRNANNVTNGFAGVRRKSRINLGVVNLFPEAELKQNADVNRDASQGSEGHTANGGIPEMV